MTVKLVFSPPKMNPAVKEKWLAALRSGTFKQGQNRLRIAVLGPDLGPDYRHCCLGVLCEVVRPGCFDAPAGVDLFKVDPFSAYPPPAVAAAAGLLPPTPGCAIVALSTLNDIHELPFPKIADWIEVNL